MHKILGPIAAASMFVATAVNATAAQAPAAAKPDDPAKLVEARAIVEIIAPTADRVKTLNTLLPKLEAQFRPKLPPEVSSDPGLVAILDSASNDFMQQARAVLLKHLPEMADADAIAYTHEFSLAELKAIHAFAETPTGHHYFSRLAFLLADPAMAKANAALIADIHDLAKAQAPQLKEKLIAYVKAHPHLEQKLRAAHQSK